MTLFYLPACPLPGMLLSRGNISEHFSRSTCPARQSSVTIWRALWHRVTLSSVRTFMSLLLSHCTPEEPGGRRFIWTPFMRRRVQPVRRRQWGSAQSPDPYPARNEERLAARAPCVWIQQTECSSPTLTASNSDALRFDTQSCWSGFVTRLLFRVMTGVFSMRDRRPMSPPFGQRMLASRSPVALGLWL